MSDLLADLAEAEQANTHGRSCQVCVALESMTDDVREGVERALSGTIGMTRLANILTSHGYVVGKRAIINHRREDHLT